MRNNKKNHDDVGLRLAAGLLKSAIKNANRNPNDPDAQQLASDMSDLWTAHRKDTAE